jgi:hypothetical protein
MIFIFQWTERVPGRRLTPTLDPPLAPTLYWTIVFSIW